MQVPFTEPLPGMAPTTLLLPVIGREAETFVIHSLLETVAQEKPDSARAMILSGEVGVGKTRLLAEMCFRAEASGFRLLQARAYELWETFPYFPFIEALRPLIRSTPKDRLAHYLGLYPAPAPRSTTTLSAASEEAATSLNGALLVSALARLFPELLALLDMPVSPETLSPEQEKFRLFDAVATLLERLALETPVLLAIDDLQWADSASRELILYLTVRLRGCRVALVGVTRPPGAIHAGSPPIPDEAGAKSIGISQTAALKALAELMRQGLLLLLPIKPLSREASEQHLHILLSGTITEDVTASLLERASGNPFFLEELVRALVLSNRLVLKDGRWCLEHLPDPILPQSIASAVGRRLQLLSPTCLEAVRVASLFGRTFPLEALAHVMNKEDEPTRASLEEAVQASILARVVATGEDEPTLPNFPIYTFLQSIVQEVLSSQLSVQQARALHGAIGSALEAYYGTQANPTELARHYTLGNLHAPALRWSILAGEHALRQQAYREAIGHFRAALRLAEQSVALPGGEKPSQALLHLSIGQSWFKLGELRPALEEWQKALEQVNQVDAPGDVSLPSPLLKARLNRMISDIYRMQGKYEMARAHLQAAHDIIDDIDPARQNRQERIQLYQAQAMLALLLFRAGEAEQALWQSHQLAVEIGDRESQAFALFLVGWIRGWGERIHEAIRLQEQAHALYVAIGDPFRGALVDQSLGIIYQALGEMERARLHNLRGLEQARRYGVRHVLGWLYWNQGVMALAEGNWTVCETHLEQATQEAESTENTLLKPIVLQAQAELHFRMGQWQRAESLFRSSVQAALNTEWYVSALALYGHFLAVTGRNAEASVQLEAAIALPEPIGYSAHFYIPFLAEGFLHLDQQEQARAYIERIRTLRGFIYYGVAVDRIRGEVAVQSEDWEGAERAFADGLALCRKIGNEPEEAAILYEEARMVLARSGKQHVPLALSRMDALCEQARAI